MAVQGFYPNQNQLLSFQHVGFPEDPGIEDVSFESIDFHSLQTNIELLTLTFSIQHYLSVDDDVFVVKSENKLPLVSSI